MDLRKLQYFIEVVEHGSLGKASRRLGVTQPALTKSLSQLERDLGVRLVDRGAGGVKPTVYGNSLFTHAKAIVAEADHARSDIHQLLGQQPDHVRVAALPSLSTGVISRAIALLTRDSPEVSVRVVDKQNYELLPTLRRSECDLAIGLAEHWEAEPGLRRRVIFSDRLELTVRRQHPLACKLGMKLADLLAFPWVFPVVGTTHGPLLKQFFAEAGLDAPVPSVESGSVHFSKMVIRQSDCIGILPRHAMETELDRAELVCLPLTSSLLHRDIALYHRTTRPLSSATQTVARAIEASCRAAAGRTANSRPKAQNGTTGRRDK